MSLDATRVTVEAGGRRLLDAVTASFRRGELCAIVGPNGAGKSTLLRTLSAELPPSGGGVTLDGRPLAALAPDLRARRIAALPQRSQLAFDFTAREVVLLGRTPHGGRDPIRDSQLADEAMRATGALPFARRGYTRLSGGEQQRVQLARVLAQLAGREDRESWHLLLDEPLSALDLGWQHRTLTVVKALARDGLGVVAVLHELELAATYADRLLLLDRGRLGADGTPEEVLRPALLSECYDVPLEVDWAAGVPSIRCAGAGASGSHRQTATEILL